MAEILWQEPRPKIHRGRERIDWLELLRPLTERPGAWALVRHYDGKASANQAANQLRKGRHALVVGRWEFLGQLTQEDAPAKGSDLYARYLGEED